MISRRLVIFLSALVLGLAAGIVSASDGRAKGPTATLVWKAGG